MPHEYGYGLGLPPGIGDEGGWFRGVIQELHAAGLPLSVHSQKAANALQVKTAPGILFGFTVNTTKATAQFIQVFDTSQVPASGAIPCAVFQINGAAVATGNDLGVSYIFPGRYFQTGIWLVNSSTQATYTAGSADCFFDAQYI